jgi:serine protease Do
MQEIETANQIGGPVEINGQPVRPVESGKRNHSSWIAVSIILGAILISMAVVQAAYYKSKGAPGASSELPAAHPVVTGTGSGPSPMDLSNTFRSVAKAVEPAVVSIDITETVKDHPPIFQFPGGFQFPNGGSSKQQASGSGFIVSPDGYILTNNHVVGKADKIDVILADGRKMKAERIGTDPDTDLAIIKINASGLPTAVLGDSDSAEQGDWVLAIGSPFRLQKTITAGIVSATGRQLPLNEAPQLDRYIQTDASINPGNSGGPLVDMQGEVIGINTLIVPGNNGGNVGIGFAIPSNLARQVYAQLIKSGKVSRGYLGVLVAPLDAAKAEALGVDVKAGVLVSDVSDPNSPAAKAGLRTGDIITAVDGKHVESGTELTDAVVAMPVGHEARVDYIRDGKPESVTVTLAERPDEAALARRGNPEEDQGDSSGQQTLQKLGIVVETVTPEMGSQRNLRIPGGALVDQVQPDSPAFEAGINRGDVIHQIGRTQINSANDLVQATKSLKSGDEVAVKVEHNGRMGFATLSID